MSQRLLTRNKNGMLTWSFKRKKGCEKKNPGFECENQMRSSGTVENLTIGCQSEICFNCTLQCLSNYFSPGEHTASSVLTIAWKDSVKTTLGWYLTRLRVLAWNRHSCRICLANERYFHIKSFSGKRFSAIYISLTGLI